jgi:hypothetical protein
MWLMWPVPHQGIQLARPNAVASIPDSEPAKPSATPSPVDTNRSDTIHSKFGGGITLRFGESCIFSYLNDSPGKATIVKISPELDEQGLIRTAMKIVETSDQAPNSELRSELLPDIFDVQRLSTLAPSDTPRLEAEFAQDHAKVISYPTTVSKPGDPVSLRSLVHLKDGTPVAGFSMTVTIDRVEDGFQLNTGIDLYRQRRENDEQPE